MMVLQYVIRGLDHDGFIYVITGLDPVISQRSRKDGRVKHGHDGFVVPGHE